MRTIEYFDTAPKGAKSSINAIIKLVEKEGVVYEEQEVFIDRPRAIFEGHGKDRRHVKTVYDPVEHISLVLGSGMVLNLERCSWRTVEKAAAKPKPKLPKRWKRIKYVGSNRNNGKHVLHKKKVFDGGDIAPALKGLPVFWEKNGKLWTLTEAFYGLASVTDVGKEVIIEKLQRLNRESMIRSIFLKSREHPARSLWRVTAEEYAASIGD